MKKITLDENEAADLANVAQSGAKGYGVMKKIFQSHMAELTSVMNIDPKGNIGLQTLARQHAYETISEMAEMFFPEDAEAIRGARKAGAEGTGDKKISQWR